MSQSNPVSVIDSVLSPNKTIDGIEVKPITISRWALLELVNSPFVNTSVKFTTTSVIPSLYIATQDIDTLCKYDSSNIGDLVKESFKWADGFKNYDTWNEIINEVLKSIRTLLRIAPENVSEGTMKGKKLQTVG